MTRFTAKEGRIILKGMADARDEALAAAIMICEIIKSKGGSVAQCVRVLKSYRANVRDEGNKP